MQKLFQFAHLRTLQRLAGQTPPPHDIVQLVQQLGTVPNTDALLQRLPREQLKHVLNMPCPINNLQQTGAPAVINSSKFLRSKVFISEEKVCGRCPFSKTCTFASKPSQPTSSENALSDIVIFMGGLNDHLNPELIHYRQWVSAYKLGDSILACIDDISKGGLEIAQHERLRLEGIATFKLKSPGEGQKSNQEEQLKKMEEHLKKVSKVAQIKKEITPKPKIQEEVAVQKQEFTFEEEPEFEPTRKFTKDSYKPKKSFKQQNSNEIVDEENGSKYEKKQRTSYKSREDNFSRNDRSDRPYKPYNREERNDFNKDRPYKPYNREERNDSNQNRAPYKPYNREERSDSYQNRTPYKPYNREERNDSNQDRPYKKNYNQEQRGSNYEGSNYKKNYDNRDRYDSKDQNGSRNYEGTTKKYDARDKYSKEKSFNKYEGQDNWQQKRQDSWKDKGQDKKFSNEYREKSNNYREKSSRSEEDSYPNIKVYSKKTDYNNPKDTNDSTPYANKSSTKGVSYSDEPPKSQPKIIQMQSINESNSTQEKSVKVGRTIRGAGRRITRE